MVAVFVVLAALFIGSFSPRSSAVPTPAPTPTALASASVTQAPTAASRIATPTSQQRQRFAYLDDSAIIRISYYAPDDETGRKNPSYPLVFDFIVGRHDVPGRGSVAKGERSYQLFVSIRSSQCALDVEGSTVGLPIPVSCWDLAAERVLSWDLLPGR